jgi:sRNA-binding protein
MTDAKRIHWYHEVRAIMHARYPAVFTARGEPLKPLKIGISDDLAAVAAEIGPLFNPFMRSWCGRPEYWAAVAAGGARYDLEGNQVGAVEDGEQRWAHRDQVSQKSPADRTLKRRQRRQRVRSRTLEADAP